MIWAPFQQGRGVQERGDRLGLVLSQHNPRRLLPLCHRMEARAAMKAEDVTETLNLALQASGLNQVHVVHRPLRSGRWGA
jgi:hypothetical protein